LSIDTYDIIIIGAGPAGLAAGIYTSRALLSTLILGNVYESQLAKSGFVENYPGIIDIGIQGLEIAERMNAQAQKWGCINDKDSVLSVNPVDDETFLVKTKKNEYQGIAVIMAMGGTSIKLDIPGEKEFENNGVSYCTVCDGSLFRRKDVAIIGRGTGLGKGSVYMIPIARHIETINTDPILKTEKTYIQRMEQAKNINIVNGAEPVSVIGEERVKGISYNDSEGNLISKDVAAVFIEAGTRPNYELAEQLGLEQTPNKFIKVNRMTQTTSMEGVFAAGDITGGRRQNAVAVGEGSSAGISALRYVGARK